MTKKPSPLRKAKALAPVRGRAAESSSAPPGSRRRALVLGEGGAAGRIAQGLRDEGFEPETGGEPVPSLSDPQALEKLRALMARFAKRAAAAPGPGAPLLHPGVSVWAERPELATLGEELGIDVICPPARVLALFANKLNLISEAAQVGIPHLTTGFDPIYGVREIERLVFNQALGRKPFPFVLKAVKGGGGFGVLVVQDASDLERKVPLWVEQVRRNLGEVALFAERYIESARHVLLPFVRHMDGRFKAFPMTDASLQCRYRKIVEFCPASGIGTEMRNELSGYARKLADHCGYVGVGTLEFLVDASRAYLVEGAARLNTGFHLWESVAGTSAVAWQLSALEGGGPGDEPACRPDPGWAAGLVLRLYAEDSLLQLPQPGEVKELSERRHWSLDHPSVHARAELDLMIQPGSRIEPSGYGMLGTLWVGASDRKQAVHFARGALDELWIAGSLQTNERFLSELLAHPWIGEGMFHAGFVDEEFLPAVRPPAELAGAFLAAGKIAAGDPATADASIRWAVGDQWIKADGSEVEWVSRPERWSHLPSSHWAAPGAEAASSPWYGASGRVRLPSGGEVRVCAFPLSPSKWQVRVGRWVLSVRRISVPAGAKPKRSPKLLALVQGRVHSLLHREGTVVPAHEPLLVLDSLGILVPHAAPVEVRVTRWIRAAEDRVVAGEELADLEVMSKG